MCNLYRLDMSSRQFASHFNARLTGDPWEAGYVAPKLPGPVIAQREGLRTIRPCFWGFPPPASASHDGVSQVVTNVRNLESPFWIGALRNPHLRCLVPVTSFQEWGGPKGAKKQYWYYQPERPVFAFAGIWRDFTDYPAFAFLTTEPNSLIAQVHPKAMPVILHEDDFDTWLSADWKKAKQLVSPFPAQFMAVQEGGPPSYAAPR